MTIYVYKAQGIGEQDIEPLEIRAEVTIPDAEPLALADSLTIWETAVRQRYEEQGQRIADALVRHLPDGTVDQLLRALLQYRASLFAVPFAERQPAGETYPTTTDPDLAGEGGAS